MVTNDATILRIKHEILYEVAKLAWNDQLETIFRTKSALVRRHSTAAVYTRRERLSARESVWQKVNVRLTAIQTTSYRLSMQPVRSARLRPTQSPITAVNVWVKPARTPVRLERSAWEIPRRTSTRINAASAESVPRHAHTMRLPIWSARVRRSAQWMRLPTMSMVYV